MFVVQGSYTDETMRAHRKHSWLRLPGGDTVQLTANEDEDVILLVKENGLQFAGSVSEPAVGDKRPNEAEPISTKRARQ